MRRLFFHEESIHEVSRRYLEHEYTHTYIHTNGQAETNMSPTFSKLGDSGFSETIAACGLKVGIAHS